VVFVISFNRFFTGFLFVPASLRDLAPFVAVKQAAIMFWVT